MYNMSEFFRAVKSVFAMINLNLYSMSVTYPGDITQLLNLDIYNPFSPFLM